MTSTGGGAERRKAASALCLSSSAVAAEDDKGNVKLETPEWFKSERVRCLTDANTPRDEGDCCA